MEIKFRIWYAGLMYQNKEIDFIDFNNNRAEFGNTYSKFDDESFVLMRYTGLNDKNGNEIYEGDVIKIGSDEHYFVINWHVEMASFVINRKGWAFSHFFGETCSNEDVEVVGNIYENKELLK
jgi:uncharacterized phage protein (TIGR01671 family)